MKKIDIEKQLAQYPNTVFSIGNQYCLITGMEQERLKSWGSYQWRVRVQPMVLDDNEGTLSFIPCRYKNTRTYLLGQVEFSLWNTPAEAETKLIERHHELRANIKERDERREQFPAVRQELRDLFTLLGISGFIDNNHGANHITIELATFADTRTLIAVMRKAVA